MSGNPAGIKRKPAKVDRRVARTRDTLGEALFELVQEKPFEEITVQAVLDRAGVGRSTFYAHYRDKNDLFLSDVENFFAWMSSYLVRTNEAPERVAPVQELFAHVAEVRDFYRALLTSGKMHDVLELGQGFFARSIEARLAPAGATEHPAQRKAQAAALAGALFALLAWWTDHDMSSAPEAMDRLFHQMIARGPAAQDEQGA